MEYLSIIIIVLTTLSAISALLLRSTKQKQIYTLGIINVLLTGGAWLYFYAKLNQNGGHSLAADDKNYVISIFFGDAIIAVFISGIMLLMAFKRDNAMGSGSMQQAVRATGSLILFGIIALFTFVAISIAIAGS